MVTTRRSKAVDQSTVEPVVISPKITRSKKKTLSTSSLKTAATKKTVAKPKTAKLATKPAAKAAKKKAPAENLESVSPLPCTESKEITPKPTTQQFDEQLVSKRLEEQERKLEFLEFRCETLQNEKKDMVELVVAKEKQFLKDKNQVQSEMQVKMDELIAMHQQHAQGLQSESKILAEQIQTLKKQLENVECDKQDATKDYLEQIGNLNKQIAHGESKCLDLQSTVQKLESTNEELLNKTKILEERLAQHDELYKNFEEQNRRLAAESSAQVAAYLSTLKEKVHNNLETEMPMSKVYEMMDETSKKQMEEIFELHKTMKKLEKSLEEQKNANSCLESEFEAQKSKFEAEKSQFAEQIIDLKASLNVTKNQLAQATQLSSESELNRLQMLATEQKQEIQTLKEQLISTNKQLEYEQQKKQNSSSSMQTKQPQPSQPHSGLSWKTPYAMWKLD